MLKLWECAYKAKSYWKVGGGQAPILTASISLSDLTTEEFDLMSRTAKGFKSSPDQK